MMCVIAVLSVGEVTVCDRIWSDYGSLEEGNEDSGLVCIKKKRLDKW